MLHYVLGITKAYTTRVGSGPFPTELEDETGERLRARGNEFGATTGRPRRCGWFDAAALKRSIQINGVSGLCVTKLDVLDGMDELKVCVGYTIDGEFSDILPAGADDTARCQPVYEDLPGWRESTVGGEALRGPAAAGARLSRPHRGDLRRADRPDLDRSGPRGDHRPAASVRVSEPRGAMADLYVSWSDYHQAIERLAAKVHESGWRFNQVVCIARGGRARRRHRVAHLQAPARDHLHQLVRRRGRDAARRDQRFRAHGDDDARARRPGAAGRRPRRFRA